MFGKALRKYTGVVSNITINVEQPFNFKNLYKAMHEWLIENRFVDRDEGNDTWEVYYNERVGEAGKELIIEWDMIRDVEGNKYYRYALNIDMHLLRLKKVEVMIDGKKTKLDEGELKLKIKAVVETDIEGKWEKHWFLKNFKRVYDQKLFKEELQGMHEINLVRLVYEFQSLVKDYLKQRCVESPEGFIQTPRK